MGAIVWPNGVFGENLTVEGDVDGARRRSRWSFRGETVRLSGSTKPKQIGVVLEDLVNVVGRDENGFC